jgi:hypothetical protein
MRPLKLLLIPNSLDLRLDMRFYFRAICVVLAILFSIINVCAAENRETKKVLILYSHKNPMPYSEILNDAIVSTLESDKTFKVELYIEYMDRTRFTGDVHLQRLLDYYHQKHSGQKMDLLIAVGFYSLDFLLKNRGSSSPKPRSFSVVWGRAR